MECTCVVREDWGVCLLRALSEEGQVTVQEGSSGLQRGQGGFQGCGGTRRD